MNRAAVAGLALLAASCSGPDPEQTIPQLAPALTFYASFEDGLDAAYARDDQRIYSAPSYDALEARSPGYGGQDAALAYAEGVSGNALSFTGALTEALFYEGGANTPWAEGGALSVWLRPTEFAGAPLAVTGADPLAPAASIDLSSDPVQLVVRAIQGEGTAVPPESDWLHVAVSISGGKVVVFLNGEESTTFDLADPEHSWEAALSTMRLGVNYVGLIDELAAFDRALTPDEVRLLHQTPNLPASLMH
jgi:hypothetical protein